MIKRSERGFTLVELIVTIVIIGILAAAMTARLKEFSDVTEAATCKQNQMHIETAQSLFYMAQYIDPTHEGRYASSLEELETYFPEGHQPKCPSNGTYLITADGGVDCTVSSHHRN